MAKKRKEEQSDNLEGNSLKEKAQFLKNRINQEKKKIIIQTYSEEDDNSIERISCGVPEFDRILGKGFNGWGLPRGRMVNISGPEGVGKTSLSLSIIAQAQKFGIVALIDSEAQYSPEYAQKFGIDIDSLLVISPETSEECFDVCEMLIRSGDVSLVCIDSLDGCVPKQIFLASAEDQFMGVAARINNRFFAKVQKMLQDSNAILVVISQIREKIGIIYGSPEVVQGGRGLKFFSSVRIDIRRDSDVAENGNNVAHIVKIKTVKSRVSAPQQVAYARLDWGKGFNFASSVLSVAISDGIIKKAGAGWLTVTDLDLKIQGEVNFIKEFESNENLRNYLLEKLEIK